LGGIKRGLLGVGGDARGGRGVNTVNNSVNNSAPSKADWGPFLWKWNRRLTAENEVLREEQDAQGKRLRVVERLLTLHQVEHIIVETQEVLDAG